MTANRKRQSPSSKRKANMKQCSAKKKSNFLMKAEARIASKKLRAKQWLGSVSACA
jgi:hypothetical protein